jgi:anti-sigma B factor antagonist
MQQQPAPAPSFSCEVHPERERVVVRLVGELDLDVSSDAGTAIDELLDVGFARIVVDLRDVTFLDSSGIHTLVAAERSASRHNCALSLIRGPEPVHRVFELTHTDSVFAFEREAVPADGPPRSRAGSGVRRT